MEMGRRTIIILARCWIIILLLIIYMNFRYNDRTRDGDLKSFRLSPEHSST